MPPKEKKKKRTNKPSPIERMKEAFGIMNLDDDRSISKEEFQKAMASLGLEGREVDNLFRRFDPDKSGYLDKEEFFAYAAKGTGDLHAMLKRGLAAEDEAEETIMKAFEAWDVNQDGKITKEELERVLVMLNPAFTKKDLTKLMKAMDENEDGEIDYEEFTNWICSKHGTKKK
ncbi:unnamed protein product [Durusdinium trenchii]|uniref:Uncharacterized protein n=2 Tax=Durusdinium trenchii TaxID=1381693 RepID=A0ABP0PB78_9DINO